MRERNPPGVFARTRFGFLSNVPKCPLGKHACTRSLGHLFLFSVLRWLVQHASILPAACCDFLRSVQQSSTQHTAIFHTAYSNLHTTYCNSSHCVLQSSTQRAEILHIAYRNLPHSVPHFFTRHTAILHIACCNPPHSIQQFPPQLTEISVCSLLMAIQRFLMAIQRLRMCIQRLQTEILAIILIHFFRVLG